jgi:hypothetical protein
MYPPYLQIRACDFYLSCTCQHIPLATARLMLMESAWALFGVSADKASVAHRPCGMSV